MLLEVTQVAIERGDRRLLSDVDLSVSGGEIWQLVGANVWARPAFCGD